MSKILTLSLILLTFFSACGQDSVEVYQNSEYYSVPKIEYKPKSDNTKIKNVILMIGDGMGITQVYAGMTTNKGSLFIENCKHIGLQKTYSSDSYITDSAAGATAFSTGKKTYNGAIGVDSEGKPLKTVLEMAEEKGLATGLVATSKITHATPASFIAHQPNREMYQAIAADFLKTDIDLFIGGGLNDFIAREDGRNLVEELKANKYQFVDNVDNLKKIKKGKLAALLNAGHMPNVKGINGQPGRGDMLQKSTKTALKILDKKDKGFFLMIEGSQIDWGGHSNLAWYIADEMMDFDKAIGQVLEYAAKDGETLVIITADHETGGFSLPDGDLSSGTISGSFTTGYHTGVLVPVFAFGPGADKLMGIYENTDIYQVMVDALGLED